MSNRGKDGLTKKQRKIKNKTASICILCGRRVDDKDGSIEHLHPKSRTEEGDNPNRHENLWWAHRACNSEKSNMSYEEYANWCDMQRER